MKYLALLLLFFCTTVGCSKTTTAPNEKLPGPFAHSVYIWLKNPASEADRVAFEQSLLKFVNASEFIVTKHIGLPAETGHRDVVDDSYTYSILLTFKNKRDQDSYQEEAVHKQFIEESSHLWTKVLVYDSENILN